MKKGLLISMLLIRRRGCGSASSVRLVVSAICQWGQPISSVLYVSTYSINFVGNWKEYTRSSLWILSSIPASHVLNAKYVQTDSKTSSMLLRIKIFSASSVIKISKIINTASSAWRRWQASGFSATTKTAENGFIFSATNISKKSRTKTNLTRTGTTVPSAA